jgi:hypothetical protein
MNYGETLTYAAFLIAPACLLDEWSVSVRSCPSILHLVEGIPFLAISRIAFHMSRVNSTARVHAA